MSACWRVQFFPHSGRYIVCDNHLEVFGTAAIASFAVEADAERFADARNRWEQTAPSPRAFGGCEAFPTPDRYELGRQVFDSDPALRAVSVPAGTGGSSIDSASPAGGVEGGDAT